MSYVKDKFLTQYIPTVFENETKQVNYKNKLVFLGLWDTV
jgi:hypothetical protein